MNYPDCLSRDVSGLGFFMMETFLSFPGLSEPLVPGILGVVLTLAGSILRSGLDPTPRKIGGCFCVVGLALMTVGFLCITSNTSLIAYAQRG